MNIVPYLCVHTRLTINHPKVNSDYVCATVPVYVIDIHLDESEHNILSKYKI